MKPKNQNEYSFVMMIMEGKVKAALHLLYDESGGNSLLLVRRLIQNKTIHDELL